MRLSLRSLALPLLASAVVFAREAIAFESLPIGFALWATFIVLSLVGGGAIVGLSYAVVCLRRRPLTRPSRSLIACALLASTLALFPVSSSWDTIEGADSASGLTAAFDATLLKSRITTSPTVGYTETCCG